MKSSPFPLTSKYDKKWIVQNSLGENVFYSAESLSQVMEFRKGLRVLDLGCGKAISSIFLAKEFEVQVWAVDKWISVTENYRRIVEASCENAVFPIQADARSLPFPKDFFDIIVAFDSYLYFGTDDTYLPYIAQFLKQNGFIGIVDTCFTREIHSLAGLPPYLLPTYQDHWYCVHSIGWWINLWEKTGLVKVVHAEVPPQNDFMLQEFINDYKDVEEEDMIVDAYINDAKGEKMIAFFRLVGQRTEKPVFLEPFEL